MTESKELVRAVEGRLDKQLIEPDVAVNTGGSRRETIRNGVETAIEVAEMNLDRARDALWFLRRDYATLERVEAVVGGRSERATLAVGAAIQLLDSELASSTPDLRGRMPELLRWLQGDW